MPTGPRPSCLPSAVFLLVSSQPAPALATDPSSSSRLPMGLDGGTPGAHLSQICFCAVGRCFLGRAGGGLFWVHLGWLLLPA